MSGGVDSSVAALLLKQQGYQVVGVFMKFWADTKSASGINENRCCSSEARRDAIRVCNRLNIPFLTWDFQKEFKRKVVDDFISGYKKGITPNPCVICNKEIKFGLFLEKALKMGADYVATGHYVRISATENSSLTLAPSSTRLRFFGGLKDANAPTKKAARIGGTRERIHSEHSVALTDHIYELFQAKDKNKDQSYFLWRLTQKQLKHCLFPIGDYIKDEVRTLAKKYKLPVAFKKESQEVCFVKESGLKEFLKRKISTKPGNILWRQKNSFVKVGGHEGVQFYTIGQRVPIGGTGPYYVAAKNPTKNQLIVVKKNNTQLLLPKEITIKNFNWISGKPPRFPIKVMVRIRYRQSPIKGTIHKSKSQKYKIKIGELKEFLFMAPGQSAVFYNRSGPADAKALAGREMLGGGIIN